jgi:hypothetical protein
MIGLEVTLNGKRLCVAGQADGGAYLELTLSDWWLREGERAPTELRVSGHRGFPLEWAHASLAPGDEIIIRIIEPAVPDEPAVSKRRDAEAEEAQERLTYEWLKHKYGSR